MTPDCAAVHVGAAQLLGGDLLAGRRLHQRRAAEEDRALLAHDDALVRHRRHIGAARRAGAHHDRDLRNAGRRHVRLIVEDAAEVVAVGKNLVLQRQERAAGIDQIDAGQMVLARDLLRAQMLLHRHRIVGAALDGGVVGDDHALAPADAADAGDDARRRHVAAIHAVRGERRQLEKRRAGIEQQVDALARQQLAARQCAALRAPRCRPATAVELCAQVLDQRLHRVAALRANSRRAADRSADRESVGHRPGPSLVSGTARGRSACAGSRSCRRRSRRAWRRAAAARSG